MLWLMEITHRAAETCPAADLAIVEALRRGEDWAFESLVERHERLMLRVASSYVRSPAVAEEVVQDTWLSVFRGIGSFECRSALKTWIFRILVNRAKTRGAGEGRSVPFSSLAADGESARVDPDSLIDRSLMDTPETESPEQRLISREVLHHAVRAMEDLPDSQRQVIAMRDIQGCSSEEVCSALGITGGNQRVQLHRARAKVKRELERYFSTAALQASPA
jgi:RNA polymerase sigma-70 factor, ECF subfamily